MFSYKLIKLLEAGNKKQSELATGIGKSISQISRYCSGASEPNYSTITDIATFFNISPSYFFNNSISEKDNSGNMLFIRGAVFQTVTFRFRDNLAIFNARFSTSRYLDKRVVNLMKKHKIKFGIIVKRGKILVDNKEVIFGIIDSIEKVFIEENTKFQIILFGNIAPLLKEMRKIYKSKSLI